MAFDDTSSTANAVPLPPLGKGSACVTLIAWSKNDNLVVVLNSALRSTAFVDTKAIFSYKL